MKRWASKLLKGGLDGILYVSMGAYLGAPLWLALGAIFGGWIGLAWASAYVGLGTLVLAALWLYDTVCNREE